MQSSLFEFDPAAAEKKFKVTLGDKSNKNIFFDNGFSIEEIKKKFPNALEVKEVV